MSHLRAIGAALLAALLVCSAAVLGAAVPAPAASSNVFGVPASRAEASLGDRALDLVYVLARDIGTRPAGSDAERRAASVIAGELRGMGYTVDEVSFELSARGESGVSQNVVARRVDEDPALPLVVIGAHYDSVPQGPGANDNASGTATMIEVARALSRDPVPNVAVRYVAFGAEEIGLLGSKDFVRGLSTADRARLRLAISVDMMAVGDQPAFGGTESWVMEAMARAESQGYQPVDQSGRLRRMSDHASFLDVGLPAVLFHWVEDPFYHTALDVPENVQVASLELMGAITIELIRVAAAPS